MFDVLVYLYENYWRPDACPDPRQLTRKLVAVGFESDEIQDALDWLAGLTASSAGSDTPQSDDAMRVYTPREPDFTKSSRLTPSHMAMPAATKIDE
ncbi:MAG: DUF494 domain-containing protein [Betaproteobacteria bacterium]|nr:DUF494 domain-containing protein [Betaproteobacteria bacterium]